MSQPSSVGNPYLYTGREYDDETGLYYYRARYYHPQLGRFLQADPIGYNDEMNLYLYVSNNPIGSIDPFGYASYPSAFKIGGGLWGGLLFGFEYGVEYVWIFGKGWFPYKHVGAGKVLGGSLGFQFGLIWDLKEPDEYTDRFDATQAAIIALGGSYFEAPDGGPWGFSVDLGPGIGVASFHERYEHFHDPLPLWKYIREYIREEKCP